MSRLQELIQRLCPNGVEYRPLGEVCNILRGKRLTKTDMVSDGIYPVYHGGLDPLGHYDKSNREANTVMIINVGASAGTVGFCDKAFWSSDGCFCLSHSADVKSKFAYYYLSNNQKDFVSKVRRAGIPTLDAKVIQDYVIPVPPIEVQEEVVRILDTFSAHAAELQAELQARKEQYDYYRNLLLTFSPSACGCGTDGEQELGLTTPPTSSYKITWKTMGEIFVMKAGKAIPSSEIKDYNPGNYCACFGANGLRGYVQKANRQTNNIIIGRQGALCGNISYAKGPYYATDHAVVIENSPVFDNHFLFHLLVNANLNQYKTSGAQPGLSVEILKQIVIPVPPLDLQLRIASILDRFEALVNDLTQGLPAEIATCRERYEYFRNKLLTFKKIA